MTETEEILLERVLDNTRKIIEILDRMNEDTSRVLEEENN